MNKKKTGTLENPFENRSWPAHEILFGMTLTGNRERILIGTRHAILARLKTQTISESISGEETQFSEDISEQRWFEHLENRVHEISGYVIDAFVTNPLTAYRKMCFAKELDAIETLPLLCDCSYELGHFLLHFSYDQDDTWSQAIFFLNAAKKFPLKKKSLEKNAIDILLQKWNTNDPVCQYTALRIWREYLISQDNWSDSAYSFVRVFHVPPSSLPIITKKHISADDPVLRLPNYLPIDDERLILWNPAFLPTECALLENSFVPLKHYYRNYMNTHNLKFNTCPVCGRVFVTNTLKKKFCSTGCADIQGRITKAEYDERTRKDALEVTYKKHYQFWHNRIVKAQNIPDFPADRLAKMILEFEKYKEASKHQKELAKKCTQQAPATFFYNWAYQQEHIIVGLMGEYEARRPRKKKPE